MATVINQGQPGVAAWQMDEFVDTEILNSHSPTPVGVSGKLTSALATSGIPIWTPVFIDPATGNVSLAVYATDATAVKPNALTSMEIPAGQYQAGDPVLAWASGNFRQDKINWPASYTTDTAKHFAFAQSPGCQIFVELPYYSSSTAYTF